MVVARTSAENSEWRGFMVSDRTFSTFALVSLLSLPLVCCDSATEPDDLALDSSFVAIDSGRVELDAALASDMMASDIGLEVDFAAIDTSMLDSTARDDASSSTIDAGVFDSGSTDAGRQDSAIRPVPTCGEEPFVDLNRRADIFGEQYVFDGRVGGNQYRGTCTAQGTIGADALHRFTAPNAGEWLFDTLGSELDTVVYIRSVCDDFDSERTCNNDVSDGYRLRHSQARIDLAAGDSVFVIVDSYHGLAESSYRLTVRPYQIGAAPSLNRADAIEIDDTTISVALEGLVSTDDPIVLVEFEWVSDDGGRSRAFSPVQFVRRSDEGMFGVIEQIDIPEEMGPQDRLNLRVIDGSANVSQWTMVNRVEPMIDIGPTGLCDGVNWRCGSGLVCDELSCGPADERRTCPQGWRSRQVEADAFGRLIAQGDNSMAIALRDGSCGGGTATQVFELTVPETGTYQLTIRPFDQPAYPVLYVRDFCDFDEFDYSGELACSTDAIAAAQPGDDSLASLRVQLAAERVNYVFVDSLGRANVPR